MINNNKLTKRTKDNEYVLENKKDIFVKPLKSEFNTELEYKEAKQKYEQKKIKKIQAKMKGKFN
jgi:CRISPR/Cas system-associated endonuclease Cas1